MVSMPEGHAVQMRAGLQKVATISVLLDLN